MVRLYDTKSDSFEEDELIHPFRMTKAEIESLDPNYKEKKKKVSNPGSEVFLYTTDIY